MSVKEEYFMKQLICPVFIVLFFGSCFVHAENNFGFYSPGKKTKVILELKTGKPYWTISYTNKQITNPSKLGLLLKDSPFVGGFETITCQQKVEDDKWKPVWGKSSLIRNYYTEVVWKLKERGALGRKFDIIFRLYDQGIAVRYRMNGEGKITVQDDQTCFSFVNDPVCWGANGEHANIGPVKLSEFEGKQFPVTLKVSDSIYAALLEAAIYDFSVLSPKKMDKTTLCTTMKESTVTLPVKTSWRVLLLGEQAGDLLTGNVMVNLNPPNQLKDSSWIKPGLAFWDWRSWGGKGTDGFTYNLDMASWRRFIDFASTNNIKYLVLDANWYGHEGDPKSNPIKSRTYLVYQPDPTDPKMADKPAPKDWKDPIDIPALITYAKARNVGIVLYINDVARHHYDFEKTLATYHEWGAAGIKYGFMRGKGQQKVLDTRLIVALCAKYQLLCDFHDNPVPPSGDRRTFPNYTSREFCHAQADAKRSFSPTTFCTTVFCNMLTGPLDMSNGFFTLNDLEKVRPRVFSPIYSTVVGETARVMITFSGLAILPDTPESYAKKADLFTFLSALPMTWDETHILNGAIGEYITTARRSGDTWFIASACNETGARLPIKLDFLKSNITYEATLYEDTAETHYKTNRESYRIRKQIVKKDDLIMAQLAPGGGHCILLIPQKNISTEKTK